MSVELFTAKKAEQQQASPQIPFGALALILDDTAEDKRLYKGWTQVTGYTGVLAQLGAQTRRRQEALEDWSKAHLAASSREISAWLDGTRAMLGQRLELLDKIEDLCGLVGDNFSEEDTRTRMVAMFLRLSDLTE